MNQVLRINFESEIALAKWLIHDGRISEAFSHLERAHVLGQGDAVMHVRSHWLMFRAEIQRRQIVAALGQLLRIVLGAIGSAVGKVPVGNTGGSDISMFKRMPVAPELQRIIDGIPPDRPKSGFPQ
ncbi:MAG: DUF3703 domain-containing protein [Betaproteobacteria bacterium]